MKNIIVVTGGAGFVGSNLIELILKKTKYKILSVDNYSSGHKNNHINHKRVKYIKSNTKNISKTLDGVKKKIHTVFHFGEFSRIYQSFIQMEQCLESNSVGTIAVFNFCLSKKIAPAAFCAVRKPNRRRNSHDHCRRRPRAFRHDLQDGR